MDGNELLYSNLDYMESAGWKVVPHDKSTQADNGYNSVAKVSLTLETGNTTDKVNSERSRNR